MVKPMLSAFKNFFVTLLIALVIFGVAAYFAVMFVTDTMSSILSSEKEQLDDIFEREEDESPVMEPDPEEDPFADVEGESFDILLVITDYRPDLYADYLPKDAAILGEQVSNLDNPYEGVGVLAADYRTEQASAIVLVRGDREGGQFTYTYISPVTQVSTPTGYHTLGEVYTYYGLEVLTEHVRALTGIGTEYELLINGYNLDELVNYLGAVTVNLSKDIYFDGRAYTTQYEYTGDAVGADGEHYVEHIPNAYTLGLGVVEATAENIYILSSLSERSMADISVKEAYTVEAVRQYMARLAEMDDDTLRAFVEDLTPNIGGYAETETGETEALPETETVEETAAPATDNPWWSAESGVVEDDETESPLFEPDTPVIETAFNTVELERIVGVLRAVSLFESVTVSYPGTYHTATEDSAAYFEPDTKTALAMFREYRKINKDQK